jgi:O-antigen ligase
MRTPSGTTKKEAAYSTGDGRATIFTSALGVLLGLSLLKFGNPVILDHLIEKPTGWEEFRVQSWPLLWGFWLLGAATALGGWVVRFQTSLPRWLVWMPLVWLVWQFVSAIQTVDAPLTVVTLEHFVACVVLFYLGLLALSRSRSLAPLWGGLLIGFVGALWAGMGQHYGGLEATRRLLYEQAQTQFVSPELIVRSGKGRVFGTLFYPNAFAGLVILLLPVMLVFTWQATARLGRIAHLVLVGCLGYVAVACLVWSKSKAGWLIALIQGLVVVLYLPLSKKLRWSLVGVALACGLAGFVARYADYFQQGATSTGARLSYWRAAVQTFQERPVFGSGPGTFGRAYARIKPKDAEMAKLVHNDYLEQASDSGVLGFLTHAAFLGGALVSTARRDWLTRDKQRFAVWLGLVGWGIQGFVEFRLYIPALAWPAFLLLGWLCGTLPPRNRIDKAPAPS